jgi:hypothetical protein
MKSANIFKTNIPLFTVLLSLVTLIGGIVTTHFLPTTLLAYEELDSTNFKMIGVTTSGGGGVLESTNYNVLSEIGRITADPRNYSTNYRLDQDPSVAFVAAQPTVQCFETDTDGTTDCTSGPAELLSGGMVAICGGNGCYDKARFEIEPYTNPSDTLYMVQISEDNFVSDTRCIDGSTFYPKTLTNCDINDFRTETQWETEDFNIQGLDSNTQYHIKISALHGDFTQSDYSIVASATTTSALLFFDIDIATDSGYTAESSPPYTVSFSGDQKLIPGSSAVTAATLIWLDVDSSSSGGMAVIQSGVNGGLYSSTTSETISSTNLDLDTGEGFGLQSYYIDYESSGYLGEITATTNYAGSENVVGEVSTDAKKIYDGDGPINDGRMGIYLKARAASERSGATDYSESINFVLVPRY